jgi:hypothetical protein
MWYSLYGFILRSHLGECPIDPGVLLSDMSHDTVQGIILCLDSLYLINELPLVLPELV